MASSRDRFWSLLLLNHYIYDFPFTTSRKYAYADDLALLHLSRDWKGLEETLSQDMATLSAYLKTWRLKLSHGKTVTVAFHLHRREAKRELKVYANDKLLPFCSVPTYLRVKLDRSRSATISRHCAKNLLPASRF